jgi:hypothetical protein
MEPHQRSRKVRSPLEVALDPRVSTSTDALAQQFALEQNVTGLVTQTYDLYHTAVALRETLTGDEKKLQNQDPTSVAALKEFDRKVIQLQGTEGRGAGAARSGPQPSTFTLLNQELGSLATTIDSSDSGPTPGMESAYNDYCRDLSIVIESWNQLLKNDLPPLNKKLEEQKLSAIPAVAINASTPCHQLAEGR